MRLKYNYYNTSDSELKTVLAQWLRKRDTQKIQFIW